MSIGTNAQKARVWLGKWTERIQRAVNRTENVRGSGIASVKSDDGGIVIHVPGVPAQSGDGGRKVYIRLSTATGTTPPFTYEGKFQVEDDDAEDGFVDAEDTLYPVRNIRERIGTNCDYQGDAITGLYKLPTGHCFEVVGSRNISDTFTVLIAEFNQPRCD